MPQKPFDFNDPLGASTPAASLSDGVLSDAATRMEVLLDEIKVHLSRRHFKGDESNPGARELMDELTDKTPREVWSRNPWVYWYLLHIRLEIADEREMDERYAEARNTAFYRTARRLAEETGSPLLTHIYLLEDAHTRACVSRTSPKILAERRRKEEEAARRKADMARKRAEKLAENGTESGTEDDTANDAEDGTRSRVENDTEDDAETARRGL